MVVEVKALPLGFRFHPTDEELVRHYLKRKITGQINSEVEVIPEIDVCKCEPWDLPEKSLIRSEDPEWFFLAPKDRKYPNGSRSNRATEAGYWKATGKDRLIKSKGDKRRQHIIGTKKTLVFHKGRAPKGERTGWIMHEYRTTEPEFECGEQGGYVLYRLFRKQEEKNERSSPEETDRSGYTPTPSRSSPDNIEANEEAFTPLNKESPESTVHDSPINLPNPVETHDLSLTRWLADGTDNMPANAVNISQMPFNGHINEVAKVDPSAGGLDQLIDSQKQHGDPNHFAGGSAAILLHEKNGVFTDSQQEIMGFGGNFNAPNAMDEIWNQTFTDPYAHSSTTSKVQYDSDFRIMPPEFENHGVMQGESTGYQNLLGGLNFDLDMPNPQLSGLYESAPLLPYDATDEDVLSMDLGAGPLHDLFNECSTEPAVQGTGITIMPRQSQSSVQQNNLFTDQGVANRRLRLQLPLSPNVESGESATNVDCEGEASCIVTSEYLDEALEESSTAEKGEPSDDDEAESTGITIRSSPGAPSSSATSSFAQQGTTVRRLRLQSNLKTGPCSINDDSSSCIIDKTESQHNAGKSEIKDDADTNIAESVDLSGGCHDDEQKSMPGHDALMAVPEAKSVPRLRKTSEKNDEVTKQEDGVDSLVRAPGKKRGFQSHLGWLVLSVALLLLLCAGVYGRYSGGI